MARTDTIYMIADSTKYNPDVEQALSDFGRGGLPLYVVYPADGGKPVVLPQVLTPGIVITALQQASEKVKNLMALLLRQTIKPAFRPAHA